MRGRRVRAGCQLYLDLSLARSDTGLTRALIAEFARRSEITVHRALAELEQVGAAVVNRVPLRRRWTIQSYQLVGKKR
jgi:hypothetical protein